MANVTKASVISVDANSAKKVPPISPLTAGEDLSAGSACYIKTSDGLVYECESSQTIDGKARYLGFAPVAYLSGEVVTLFSKGIRFTYGASMTAGTYLWISQTVARLADIPTVTVGVLYVDQFSGDDPVAIALSSTDILVLR